MSGVSAMLFSVMGNGTRVIVRKPYSPQLCLEIIKKHKVGLMICPPAQLQLLLLEKFEWDDLNSLFAIFCGGSAVPQSLIQKFKVPVITGYGLTEGGVISMAGQVAANVVVKIVDDNGNQLGVGERGEICAKIPFPFLGYYRNREATEAMFKDGFVHTGDIGLFDEGGNLSVVDRKKEIFKYNNFHINPTEVERVLQDLEGVGLVSVVGIPNHIFASLPAAVIIKKTGSALTELDVHQYAKENLAKYKFLRGGVYFVKEMPMTVSGKIIRRLTTKLATELLKKNPDIGFEY